MPTLPISIHAPRVGSDPLPCYAVPVARYFNPRSPCGERQAILRLCLSLCPISIHAPRVGSDTFALSSKSQSSISIHAPRVGSDWKMPRSTTWRCYFNPRSPCGERRLNLKRKKKRKRFQSTLPVWGATGDYLVRGEFPAYFNPRSPCGERQQRCIVFSFASSAKRVFFVIFSKLGAIFRGSAEKGGGDFLSRSVRTSRGKYGCLAFAFRESGGLRANRRFYSQSVLFSFRIDCQGSRIAGCPFRGP